MARPSLRIRRAAFARDGIDARPARIRAGPGPAFGSGVRLPPGESTTANGVNAPVRAIRTAAATNGRVHPGTVIAVTKRGRPRFKRLGRSGNARPPRSTQLAVLAAAAVVAAERGVLAIAGLLAGHAQAHAGHGLAPGFGNRRFAVLAMTQARPLRQPAARAADAVLRACSCTAPSPAHPVAIAVSTCLALPRDHKPRDGRGQHARGPGRGGGLLP